MREIIAKKASRFREALEGVSTQSWANCGINDFPYGACGHCAELLAHYLKRELEIDAVYASGHVKQASKSGTHAWLEYDGLIIDISADQFGLSPVIVTRESNWHAGAREVDRHPIIRDGWWAEYGIAVYKEAVEIIRLQAASGKGRGS